MGIADMRREINRAINTLTRRFAATTDEAERAAIREAIDGLNGELDGLNQGELLDAVGTLSAATEELERAIAAARKGPFDGYLAAVESHLHNFNVLGGEVLAREALAPAPLEKALRSRARAGTGLTRARAPARGTSRGAAPATVASTAPATDFASLRDGYQRLFDTLRTRPGQEGIVAYYVRILRQNRGLYEAVGADLGGIPWPVIGAIHGLECSFRLDLHLHNGDPLTARTTHVPKGRPLTGTAPFTWRDSAADALRLRKLDKETDWSIPRMLYVLEGYNGFGYRRYGINTPYLWSLSNHHEKGKFVADGKFDPNAPSKQCGAALMLKAVLGT